jgi:hypothetical protein
MPVMKNNILALICLVVVSLPTFAAESPFEIALAPWPPIDSSTKYGGTAKLNLDLGYFVNENWEVQLGAMFGFKTSGTSERLSGVYGGALYNFSEDHLRSFVVGGGLGYVNHYPLVIYDPDYPSSVYYYIRGGKRFLLSESYQITYFPYVEAVYGIRTGDRNFGGEINVFNFSILF